MLSLFFIAGFASVGLAQYSGWDIKDGQINSTMCTWRGLQAAVVRDTLYLDGGNLWWRPQFNDGSYGQVIQDDQKLGTLSFSLNFSTPFPVSASQNVSALFTNMSKGSTASLYLDGAMLANYDEYFLYGGNLALSNINAAPPDDQGFKYKAYDYANDATAFSSGYNSYDLEGYGNLSTRNVAYGAAANVPSENLAFYFSGLRGPTWAQISSPPSNISPNTSATNASNTLISLDFTTQNQETWTNHTLPESIAGRASPEMVWVPVGEKGILVALGGVVYPEFATSSHRSIDVTASEAQSPKFMTDIDIYDIANNAWYTQSTTGGPGALTQGCAVMQPAADYSSFNIYWYGGYDGLNATDISYWNDAVWVLSLPSFTWTMVAEARDGMARAGHRCVMPYPDQMLVIGGTTTLSETETYHCIPEIFQLFNLSSATWLDKYDPSVWSNYSVPNVVYEVIGGDGSGGATATEPSSWNDTALGEVFQVKYDQSKIKTYYPYAAVTTTAPGSNSTATTGSKESSSSGVPKYLPPVLGVILGLIFISSVVVIILLWRRRKLLKKNGGASVVSTDEHGNRIVSWINGQSRGPPPVKTETVTSTEDLTHPRSPSPSVGLRETQRPAFMSYFDHQYLHLPHEVANNEIVELPATTGPAELSEDPMTPGDIVNRTFSGSIPRQGANSIDYSSAQHTDQGSLVSSNSFARNAPGPPPPPSSTSHGGASSLAGSHHPAPAQPQQQEIRPDSSALPTPLARDLANKDLPELPASPHPRGDSGVSAFSERERAHLRNTSDPATVSTMDAVISSPPRSQMAPGHRVASPPILEEGSIEAANSAQPAGIVSPPTNSTAEGEDYLGARGMHSSASPVEVRADPPRPASRRSAFRESAEDLDGSGRP